MAKTIVAAFLIFLLTRDAYAYIDPQAGSIVAQVLLGGAAGIVVLGRMYWARIREVLGFNGKHERQQTKPH